MNSIIRLVLSICLFSTHSIARPMPDSTWTPGLDTMKEKQCFNTLFSPRGVDTSTYVKSSVQKDMEFVNYLLAVIYVESRFNPRAISNREAYGLMQMTAIAVEDAVQACNLKPVPDMQHLLDAHSNIRYGSCYLRKLLREMDGDWTRTLIAYNGGYKQLIRFDRGQPIASETEDYVRQVQGVLQACGTK